MGSSLSRDVSNFGGKKKVGFERQGSKMSNLLSGDEEEQQKVQKPKPEE